MSGPDISEFIRPDGEAPAAVKRRKKRPGGLFAKGPIPLAWIVAASQEGGSCLAVGMVIRAFCGMGQGEMENSCILSHRNIAELLGCSESSVGTAIRRLVKAGLIECHPQNGRRNKYRIPE